MKTYDTWEAIKMLTENNKLEFDWYNDFEGTGRLRRDIEVVDAVNCYDENGDEISIGLDEKWTLVPQPVSFMEAAEACFHGKTIICKIGNETFEYAPITQPTFNAIGDKNGFGLFLMGILQGKWYIKEV